MASTGCFEKFEVWLINEAFKKFILASFSSIPFNVWPIAAVPIKNIRLFKILEMPGLLRGHSHMTSDVFGHF